MTPGESVYGEKRVSIAGMNAEGEEEKVEYRVWNPFRSKLAAGILGGLDDIHVSQRARRSRVRGRSGSVGDEGRRGAEQGPAAGREGAR